MAFRIAALCGSLRADSLNRKLLQAAIAAAPPELQIAEAEPRLGALPHFDQDLEREPWPARVLAFAASVRAADAVLIVTPEYNAGPPGPLKNAIDWLSRSVPPGPGTPIGGKPVALLGASPGRIGTARAQGQLRANLQNLRLPVLPGPDTLVANAPAAFDDAGNLVDAATRKALDDTLSAFVIWVRRHRT